MTYKIIVNIKEQLRKDVNHRSIEHNSAFVAKPDYVAMVMSQGYRAPPFLD